MAKAMHLVPLRRGDQLPQCLDEYIRETSAQAGCSISQVKRVWALALGKRAA